MSATAVVYAAARFSYFGSSVGWCSRAEVTSAIFASCAADNGGGGAFSATAAGTTDEVLEYTIVVELTP
jgi:hypothetical protein